MQSYTIFTARSFVSISRFLFLQITVSPRLIFTRSFTSSYSSVFSKSTMLTSYDTSGLSIPDSKSSFALRINSFLNSSRFANPSSSSEQSSCNFTSLYSMIFAKVIGYLLMFGLSTQGSFPSSIYPLYACGMILVTTLS